MSIEQTDVVDFIGVHAASDSVRLGISDHLDWENEREHLHLLQSKINTYLRFIESGEINESYPKAVGRRCIIELYCQHALSTTAADFITAARNQMENSGIQLDVRHG